jgi:hypothetical protein
MNKIAMLNDKLRKEGDTSRGVIAVTTGASASGNVSAIMKAVREYDDFIDDSDYVDDHDFGMVTVDGENYYWKIDYFDSPECECLADDPADESVYRLLIIMRTQEF